MGICSDILGIIIAIPTLALVGVGILVGHKGDYLLRPFLKILLRALYLTGSRDIDNVLFIVNMSIEFNIDLPINLELITVRNDDAFRQSFGRALHLNNLKVATLLNDKCNGRLAQRYYQSTSDFEMLERLVNNFDININDIDNLCLLDEKCLDLIIEKGYDIKQSKVFFEMARFTEFGMAKMWLAKGADPNLIIDDNTFVDILIHTGLPQAWNDRRKPSLYPIKLLINNMNKHLLPDDTSTIRQKYLKNCIEDRKNSCSVR